MINSLKTFLILWIVFLFTGNAFALVHPEREQGHFRIADSSGSNFIHFRVTAYDSVSVTSFENADTHVDNEFVGRLRYLGKLGSDFTFNGLIQVANDKTNRDIPPHFYDPYDGFPYNRQSGSNRTWDIFRLSMKYDLPFVLLSDPELQAIQAYGVWQEKKLYGKVSYGVVRTTFLIDEQGNIEKVMPKVKPDTNAAEILAYLGE